jgi:hypothetical protein
VEGDFVVVGVGKNIEWLHQIAFKTTQPVGKSTFDCLMELKEFYMVKLTHGLKVHQILLRDQPTTRSTPHHLTMMEFCHNVKKWKVIQNEIMVFHKHLQPMVQSPHPHIDEM